MSKKIAQDIKELKKEQEKLEQFQKKLEEYIRKNFHDCLEQFGMKEHNKRLKSFLDETEHLNIAKSKDPKLEPINDKEESFEEFVDIFKLSNEEFNELFPTYDKTYFENF